MIELRCPGNKLHAMVIDDPDIKAQGVIEVRCGSRWCKQDDNVVVLHRFDLGTGEITTRRYSEPHRQTKKGA